MKQYNAQRLSGLNNVQQMKAPIVTAGKEIKIPKKEQSQKSTWQKLIHGIVRPPRSTYRQTSLGLGTFVLRQTRYERRDVKITHIDKVITLTTYEPENKNNWLVLYLHGNSSSRLQCSTIIKYLPRRYALASFDFIGCGHNHQADTVTLGVRQSEQVDTVVKFLKQAGYKVVLWGRSMGAATAIKYGKAPVIVADSAFSSFRDLCKQIAHKNSPQYLPNCFISCLFPCVFCKLKSDVQERAGYDIEQLDIVSDLAKINPETLMIFMSGDEDTLIHHSNSQTLYESFHGPHKYLQLFKGTHNTKRPEESILKIMAMISDHISHLEQRVTDVVSKTKIDIQLTSE